MTKTSETTNCRCGCGAPIKGTYKQGHDARHVSNLVSMTTQGLASVAGAMEELAGSPRLQVKFERAYNNAQAKARAKAARAQATAERKADQAARAQARSKKRVFSEVKIGRWSYPVEDVVSHGDQFQVSYTAKSGLTKEIIVGIDKLK